MQNSADARKDRNFRTTVVGRQRSANLSAIRGSNMLKVDLHVTVDIGRETNSIIWRTTRHKNAGRCRDEVPLAEYNVSSPSKEALHESSVQQRPLESFDIAIVPFAWLCKMNVLLPDEGVG